MDSDEYYSLPEAVASGWENAVDYQSTSSRSEFWWWMVFEYAIVILIMTCAGFQIGGLSPGIYKLILILWELLTALPDTAVCMRRFRDVGASLGLLIVLFLFEMFKPTAFIALIVVLVIGSLPKDTF